MPSPGSRDPKVQIGLDKLEKGSAMVREAILRVEGGLSPADSETQAREGLSVLRSAVDWLEDSPYFDGAHRRLDDAGQQVRLTFGCYLAFDPEDGYSRTCPVDLAHTRVGISTGFIVEESECSICQKDPEDCDHITGQHYGDETCVRVITRADLLEVSLVGRPRLPDARIHRVSVLQTELESALGPAFRYGMTVSCDMCIRVCNGVFEWD